MNWGELAHHIKEGMTREQRKSDVTVFDANDGEYHPCSSILVEEETDVLDKGHPFLTINQFLSLSPPSDTLLSTIK